MDPALLRQCLYIRALEEGDPTGEKLPVAERVAASKAAAGKEGLEFGIARSQWLGKRLSGEMARGFESVARIQGEMPRWAGPVAALLAFAVGWWTHDLGPERTVSLLAFPLLGLMVWNLLVVGVSLVGMLRRKPRPVMLPSWLKPKVPATGDVLVDQAVARVDREWQEAQAARVTASLKLIFHTAALLLAAGVVAGMYARGLVRNYQAGWESTFLDQEAVSQLTGIVLGPASLLTAIPVPPVPPEGGWSPAAPWIHLWAASAGLMILMPRLLLISMSHREGRRAGRDWKAAFSSWEASARRLAEGQPLVARVLPVQNEPDSPLRDALRALLQHLWGGQVMVDFLPVVQYGEEEENLSVLQAGEAPTHLVLLLPMAVTPEDEIHGELQRGLQQWLSQAVRPPFALTILDATSFEARLTGMPEAGRRVEQRSAAWQKILHSPWPVLVWDSSARRNPAAAADQVREAREPLRLWTAGT